MNAISQASEMFFGANARGKVLNLKVDTAALRNRGMSSQEAAQMLIDSETAIRNGTARLVTKID